MLEKGLYYSKISEGALDITIGSVSKLWDFTAENPELPNDRNITETLNSVDYKKVMLDKNIVTLKDKKMEIDLGCIAKGYIADQIKEYLLAKGVNSAVINLGGNVLCIGEKPSQEPFRIGIQKPFANRNETLVVVELSDESVVSSGSYERYFIQNGKRYHHILNPKTGYPYENNIAGVTIFSKSSVDGDGFSTACFALGLEKGMELINKTDNIEAIFVMEDGSIYYSEHLEESVRIVK